MLLTGTDKGKLSLNALHAAALIIVIFSLGSVIAFAVRTKSLAPQNSEAWRLCRNDEAGYQLKYPNNWFVYGDGSGSTYTPAIVRETTCSGVGVLLSEEKLTDNLNSKVGNITWISVSVYHKKPVSNLSLEAATSTTSYLKLLRPEMRRTAKNSKINGEDALIWTDTEGIRTVIMFHDEIKFVLSMKNTSEQLFDKIASSFEFLR